MDRFSNSELATELSTRAVTNRTFMTYYGAIVFGGMAASAGKSAFVVLALTVAGAIFHGKLSQFPGSRLSQRMSALMG